MLSFLTSYRGICIIAIISIVCNCIMLLVVLIRNIRYAWRVRKGPSKRQSLKYKTKNVIENDVQGTIEEILAKAGNTIADSAPSQEIDYDALEESDFPLESAVEKTHLDNIVDLLKRYEDEPVKDEVTKDKKLDVDSLLEEENSGNDLVEEESSVVNPETSVRVVTNPDGTDLVDFRDSEFKLKNHRVWLDGDGPLYLQKDSCVFVPSGTNVKIDFGINFEVPEGYKVEIVPNAEVLTASHFIVFRTDLGDASTGKSITATIGSITFTSIVFDDELFSCHIVKEEG